MKAWVQNFWLIEKTKGLKFQRAVMPADAVDSKLRLLTAVDAAKLDRMVGCLGGFKLNNRSWSNKLLRGRSLLAKSESIPKDELEALCGGSNLTWAVQLHISLQEWAESSILFSDSTIPLCWLTSEKLRLSLFHRVLQTRRGSDLETVFHVKTDSNLADCGTRPYKLKLSDIGPESRWENGDQWMNQTWKKLLCFSDPIMNFIQFLQYFVLRKGKKVTVYTKFKSEIPFLWLYCPLCICYDICFLILILF